MIRSGWVIAAAAACALACAACGPPPLEPLPPDGFAFGVFGDGPYEVWEDGRYRRVLADVADARVAWLIHVGDLAARCPDRMYAERARELSAVPYPVVYTPGDNEWTDCRGEDGPLGRLDLVRRTFFADPRRSLGATPIALETQADDPAFGEFRENARWRRAGIVFATVHMVGSSNGLAAFAGRTPASDAEVERRTRAALAWMAQAFDTARATGAKMVVIAFHAEVLNPPAGAPRRGYEEFVAELTRLASSFPGEVLAVHGDGHDLRIDRPFRGAAGRTIENLTRIETPGSPQIAWLRVVVDTVTGHFVRAEARSQRGWW